MRAPFNLTRRKLLVIAWIMIGGVALVAGGVLAYFQFENAAGKRVWDDVKQLAFSRGEPLLLAQTLPLPVQPSENFGATSTFAISFGRQAGAPRRMINGRDSSAAKWRMAASIPTGTNNGASDPEMKEPGFGFWWQGEAVPLDEWRTYLGTPDILNFLDTHAADMTEIAAASRLPYARFNVDYEHSVLAGMPYLPAMRSLSRLFALRAAARIEKREGTAALEDVITLFRLVHALREEPFILTHLAANANATVGLQVLREGLARGSWSDAELTVLAGELARIDLLGNAMRGLRAELAFSTELMERLGRDPEATLSRMTNGGGYDARFVHYVPNGWVYRNMALSGRIFLDGVFPAYDAVSRRINLHQLAMIDRMVRNMEPGPHTILTRMFMPGFFRAMTNSAATQSQLEMARIACGLEIYRRAHGTYPESLHAIRDFSDVRALHDLVTGGELRYQSRADGKSFVLYTTGADQIDDGGVIALTEEGSLNPHKGDWVWPAPMTVEGTRMLTAQRRKIEQQHPSFAAQLGKNTEVL